MDSRTPIQDPHTQETCYHFDLWEYPTGLLDFIWEEAVEATYIIHLEGNGRLEKIKQQLETFHPTRKVYILHNQGYQSCDKSPEINKPSLDLVDANLEIFRHAREKGYGNILILEDDFQFDTKILFSEHRDEIAAFLAEHIHQDFMYLLGCLPVLMIPVDIHAKHYLLEGAIGMHAVIYSSSLRERILEKEQILFKDWDIYHNIESRRYTYFTPLCYQLFPETENQKQWVADYWYLKPFVPLSILIIKGLKLDTQYEPGYSLFYGWSKFLCWLLVLVAIGLLLWFVRSWFVQAFLHFFHFISGKRVGKIK